MDGVFNLINLIFLALAIAVLLRLRSVLGRRTGHEQPPPDGRFFSKGEEDAAAAPKVVEASPAHPSPEESEKLTPLQRGLKEISLADRSFHPEQFLQGARIAYEQIIAGFAAGDRERLGALLGEDAFRSFDAVMQARDQRNETGECEVVAIHDAAITQAQMRGLDARVTVRFQSELLSCVRDSNGNVVDGDTDHPHRAEDIWTFERNTRERDPNWRLVKTSSV